MTILFWKIIRNKLKWCRFFHTAYMNKEGMWECPKCKIPYPPKLSDNDVGPM